MDEGRKEERNEEGGRKCGREGERELKVEREEGKREKCLSTTLLCVRLVPRMGFPKLTL